MRAVVNTGVCILTNAYRIYLIWCFIRVFMGKAEVKKSTEVLACSAFLVVNTGLYLIFHMPWINACSNLIGIGFLVRLYTKQIRTILFLTSGIYACNACCDTISIRLFVDYQAGKEFNQWYTIVTVFLMAICVLLAEKVIDMKGRYGVENSLSLILVPAVSIGILLFLGMQEEELNTVSIVISSGILTINFLVFYLYNKMVKSISREYENKMLRQTLQAYANQFDAMLQSENHFRSLKHDLKHHLNEIAILSQKEDLSELHDYIQSMHAYVQNPDEMVDSGNPKIDSVLNFMLQKAKKELLIVETKIILDEHLRHSFALNIIIGNLLENAIEAAGKTEKKWLSVFLCHQKGIFKIQVENSFQGEVKKIGRRFLTTKKQKKDHGIGLESVKMVVEKYHGMLDIHSEESIFCVKVLLYMDENS